MAAPNFATAMGELADIVDLAQITEVFTAASSTGYVDKETVLIQNLDTDFAAAILAQVDIDRASISAPLTSASLLAKIEPLLFEIAKAINSTRTDSAGIFRDLYDYMSRSPGSQTLNSREMVYGTPSAAGGNTGNGELIRLTVDEDGFIMEGVAGEGDSYSATCTADARQLGVSFEEEFLVEGTAATKDNAQITGTGIEETIRCVSERDAANFVQNPGFEITGGTAPTAGSEQTPTSISGWTPTSGGFTNLSASVDVLYRTPPASSTSQSIRFTGNETLSQDVVSVKGTQFDPDTPLYVDIKVYREASCDGTFTITLGGVSRAVTMSTLNNAAWNIVRLVATPGASSWYKAFKANSLTLSYALASRTVGTIYLDAGITAPFSLLGGGSAIGRGGMGTWIVALSGTTPWVFDDSWTWTDSVGGTRGEIQFWLAVAGLGYLPHTTGGTETIPDN